MGRTPANLPSRFAIVFNRNVSQCAYVATLGSYQATYASLAGAIVFLIWLWISNVALLAGVALNAELAERRREHPAAERETARLPRGHRIERPA